MTENSVAKDMFYHDWNLPSIRLQNGHVQISRKELRATKRWNVVAIKTTLIGPMWARRFHRRNLAVLLERLICSSWDDIQRYRVAKNPLIPLASRQTYIVDSVLNPKFLSKLVRGKRHKSPLTLRNGL
jgi:anaerobic magnesium-protoporphyrin IX monomethyl ester cyclase